MNRQPIQEKKLSRVIAVTALAAVALTGACSSQETMPTCQVADEQSLPAEQLEQTALIGAESLQTTLQTIESAESAAHAVLVAQAFLLNYGVILETGQVYAETTEAEGVSVEKWKQRMGALVEGYALVPRTNWGITRIALTSDQIKNTDDHAYLVGTKRLTKRKVYVAYEPNAKAVTLNPRDITPKSIKELVGVGLNVDSWVQNNCGVTFAELIDSENPRIGTIAARNLYARESYEQLSKEAEKLQSILL